ncbi:hypothetical protein [Nocardiopsis salina]|nr:hypothetical protein [Nocardiopsis salina]
MQRLVLLGGIDVEAGWISWLSRAVEELSGESPEKGASGAGS